MLRLTLFLSFLVVGICLERPRTQAAFVVGGGGLMTNAYAQTIQNWLGNEEIQFTNIYTKQQTDNASHFQAAVVGQSKTITLIELVDAQTATAYSPTSPSGRSVLLSRQIVGGYNPKSWRFDNIPTMTSASDRTAFLFNLNSSEKFSQLSSSLGAVQTLNFAAYGPAFGAEDLVIDSSLKSGNAKGYAYGSDPSVNDNRSIIWTNEIDEGSITGVTGFAIRSIEVYSISSIAAVPEPATVVLWGVGAIGFGVVCGRRKSRPSPQRVDFQSTF